MNIERYTVLSGERFYREPTVVPDWARMEHLENIVPLASLWKIRRSARRK